MKILIAEDEIYMQKIIGLYLKKEGYQGDSAHNGEEALNMLCVGKYDLLITD